MNFDCCYACCTCPCRPPYPGQLRIEYLRLVPRLLGHRHPAVYRLRVSDPSILSKMGVARGVPAVGWHGDPARRVVCFPVNVCTLHLCGICQVRGREESSGRYVCPWRSTPSFFRGPNRRPESGRSCVGQGSWMYASGCLGHLFGYDRRCPTSQRRRSGGNQSPDTNRRLPSSAAANSFFSFAINSKLLLFCVSIQSSRNQLRPDQPSRAPTQTPTPTQGEVESEDLQLPG